ncbi:MAG: hypothetical protein HY553_19395 [Elusimicrobia bacterium]|nr:hypothetical protein [Elusimicrobiota bacterium]
MKFHWRVDLVAGLFFLAAPAAALTSRTGAAAAEFLRLGAGGRALGMGEAFTAVAEGPEAAYWNPAGVAHTPRLALGYTRAELPGGLHNDFIAVAAPTAFLGGVTAAALTRFSQEKLDRVDATNRDLGQFAPHSEAIAVSYAREFLSDDSAGGHANLLSAAWRPANFSAPVVGDDEPWTGRVAFGATAKMVREDLGTRSASTFAADLGVILRPTGSHNIILAGAVRHLGGRLRFISESEPLPAEAAAAAAYDARLEDWRLLTAFEADMPYAGGVYGKLGLEASRRLGPSLGVALRVGYNSRSSMALGVLTGLSAGAGLRTGPLSLDVAFQPQSVLGESLRLSVGWRF